MRTIATTAVVIGLLAAAQVPAAAAPVSDTGRHCVTNLSTHAARCFTTATAAIAHITGGRITDAPATTAELVRDEELTHRLNNTGAEAESYLLSIEWEHRYRGDNGGDYRYATGSYPCIEDGLRDYQMDDIRESAWGPAWNDRISSFQGYNTCDVNHYEHSWFTGDSTGPKRYMDSMGDMNDKTTSLTWG